MFFCAVPRGLCACKNNVLKWLDQCLLCLTGGWVLRVDLLFVLENVERKIPRYERALVVRTISLPLREMRNPFRNETPVTGSVTAGQGPERTSLSCDSCLQRTFLKYVN